MGSALFSDWALGARGGAGGGGGAHHKSARNLVLSLFLKDGKRGMPRAVSPPQTDLKALGFGFS